MDKFSQAAICTRGHIITSSLAWHPADPFCGECGAEVLTKCPHCATGIRGFHDIEGGFVLAEPEAPGFCFHCGQPFPWTAERLSAAKELADEAEDLTHDQREAVKKALDDISSDGPRTELGAARLKKLLAKVGGPTGKALWRVAEAVATEGAKRMLLGG